MLKDASVEIQSAGAMLSGELNAPDRPNGVIVFAHGSGSSRKSPRNRSVAAFLRKNGFATLLFDLLTKEEDEVYGTRFDIDLLKRRLVGSVEWLAERREMQGLPIALFGASTGAAAAFCAAAALGRQVCAVVSRGGRPDLAQKDLHKVLSPSLFVVGGKDTEVLILNRKAMEALPAGTIKKLEIVPDATHLFQEPGAMTQVEELASDWFSVHAQRQGAP